MTVYPNIVGFTGSSKIITARQEKSLGVVLDQYYNAKQARHGDCIVGDSVFHDACLTRHIPVVIHPPSNSSKRAYCKGAVEVLAEKDYLERNRDIVDESTMLIAMPDSFVERIRSGSWYTIRYALKVHKMVCIIYPDGFIQVDYKHD